MRILLTGANGFIGRYLLARLIAAGHEVVPAVRRPEETDALLPAPVSIKVDFNTDIYPDVWVPRLAGIDAVVNCAGILQGTMRQSIRAVHEDAPIALFEACRSAGVRRVIQISAISAEESAGTLYADTKRAADRHLAACDLDWVILRPSLVFAAGAFGGTALLRALAALPWITPVPGHGDQVFQPIHVDDLATAVLRVLAEPAIARVTIDPVGPETLTLREIVIALRRWLGFGAARVVAVPLPIIRLFARIGDLVGGTLNTTALKQLLHGNAGPVEPFTAATGIRPRRFADALLAEPAQVADRWQARLYFLRPTVRWMLAVYWLVLGASALATVGIGVIMGTLHAQWLAIFNPAHPLASTIDLSLYWIQGFAALPIGLLLLTRWRPAVAVMAQAVILGSRPVAYVALLSENTPLALALWGLLFKFVWILPILAAALVLAALERER